ncbi:MAG: HypC/HybG/HupF family hydrogenase formation chaperone [Candidatus Aenigmarchaeota archaeon]|nr:HypC/HybG/HupF family hydrogenase formation chaperone [Candidatus Aenigmarchaeota archaeon]
MCLAFPAKVIEIIDNEKAIADFGNGVKKQIKIMLTPDVKLGEYVLVHVGFAIEKLKEGEVCSSF